MFLERIQVSGYHGIKDLDIEFGICTAIIGENGWGKSSLYHLLDKVFGTENSGTCIFSPDDFRVDHLNPKLKEIKICFSFREKKLGQVNRSHQLQLFKRYWCKGLDDFFHIYFHIEAKLVGEKIGINNYFSNEMGEIIRTSSRDIQKFIAMNPVFLLRDTRMGGQRQNIAYQNNYEKKIGELAEFLKSEKSKNSLDQKTLKEGIEALNYIMSSYMSDLKNLRLFKYRTARDIASRPISLSGLGSLQNLLNRKDCNTSRFIMVLLQKAIMDARGDRVIPRVSFPILLLEDIESRLHPSFLMTFMSIIENMSMQKIITTNSGDLLSCLSLSDVRRIYKNNDETCTSYRLNESHFSADDLRRLTFHVRITRPMSIFARCWLLVEGETEIWLMLQLASIAGFNLQAEGVRIIEFAQCGSPPLIRVAKQLGINWHLMADGDDAGTKYVKQTKNFVENSQKTADHVTLLPNVDIEHFLYYNGFESVYRIESGYGFAQNIPDNKIIERAIHRRTKPGLAINVVEKADRLGHEGIPKLLRNMFEKLIKLANDPNL